MRRRLLFALSFVIVVLAGGALHAQGRVRRCPAHTAIDGTRCQAVGASCEGLPEHEGSRGFVCTCTREREATLVWRCAAATGGDVAGD